MSAVVLDWTIWLFLLNAIFASNDELQMDPPLISNDDGEHLDDETSTTLELGTNFSMNCFSKYPITWKPFKGCTGPYEVNHVEQENGYNSMIHLINVTRYHVGFYFCVANSTQSVYDYSIKCAVEHKFNLFDSNDLSKWYVYVVDDDNLLVPGDFQLFQKVVIGDIDFLVIPCKATSTAVKVKLLADSVEINKFQHLHNLQHPFHHRYDVDNDLKVGFFIAVSSVDDLAYGKNMTCSMFSDRSFEKRDVHFKVRYRVPTVHSSTGFYAKQGQQLTLNCSISALKDETLSINWTLPNNKILSKENRVDIVEDHPRRPDLQVRVSTITISNVNVGSDTGYYECEVVDHLQNRTRNGTFIEILDRDFIDLSVDATKIEISSTKMPIWRVKYRGYPKPTFEWYDSFDTRIPSDDGDDGKFHMKIIDNYIILKIYFISSEDSGIYTLKAFNAINATEIHLELVVKVRPFVNLYEIENSVNFGELLQLTCDYTGYPKPTVYWTFTTCSTKPQWPNCETKSSKIEESQYRTYHKNQTSTLDLNVTGAGKVECVVENTEGSGFDSTLIEASDVSNIENPFRIIPPIIENIVAGDNVTAVCEASAYRHSDLNWFLDGDDINGHNFQAERFDTEYTLRSKITWNFINTSNSGEYTCYAEQIDEDEPDSISFKIEVHEPRKPKVDNTRPVNESMAAVLGEPVSLDCNIVGFPDPEIKWFRNGKFIKNETTKTLIIKKSIMEDDGEFKCVGQNLKGKAEKSIKLKIHDVSFNTAWIALVVVPMLVSIICIIYSLSRLRRERRLRRELGLGHFVDKNVNGINPDLALHEQADLLPYNEKYEFSRKKLKLGEQLGAGAFGIVMKGVAFGILPNEKETTVAVKMVKQSADNEQIRALVSELKIMIHLRQHLNVVNLLGAVTKNITKREVMVIVEYCRFGNLQNFLIQHRHLFIDQRNPENDSIDRTISKKERRLSYDSGHALIRRQVAPTHLNLSGSMDNTHLTASTSGETAVVLSNNSVQPVGNTTALRQFTTSDLICWLFQVAMGMEYLASRKVIHGDLASRNILLCDDNVVKICDFGLARSMSQSNNYIKTGKDPLPLKWLAIESINDRVFSTLSDVWSFGIVMWELFSLGTTPYPGMDAKCDLYVKLKDGYRMVKPDKATQDIYDIMLHCWNDNPETRPSFNALEKRLRNLLDNEVTEHYIELNEQYVRMNANNLKQGETDYLSLVGPPQEIAKSTCDSENRLVAPSSGAADYLTMKPIIGSGSLVVTRDIEVAVNNPGYLSGPIGETSY